MRLPGLLVFIIFVPLQIWLFLELKDFWGYWWTLLMFLVVGILGNRAARAPWLTAMLFPHRAIRHETRRHVFQGILFLAAGLTFLLPKYNTGWLPATQAAWVNGWPQPWLPLLFLVTLLKAALR